MTMIVSIPNAQEVIALVGTSHSLYEELSDSELDEIAGGGERIYSYPVSGSMAASGSPGGKVFEVSTQITAHVKTVDLPRVGNIVSRAATATTLSVSQGYGTRDSHAKPQYTFGY